MAYSDKHIGENVQRFRRQMTQTELANAMKRLGHRWSQPTVVAVEKGDRALRFSEAIDLAQILEIHVTDLTKTAPWAAYTMEKVSVDNIFKELGELFAKLRDARLDLSQAAGQIHTEMSEAEAKSFSWMLTCSPDDIARVYAPHGFSVPALGGRRDGERPTTF